MFKSNMAMDESAERRASPCGSSVSRAADSLSPDKNRVEADSLTQSGDTTTYSLRFNHVKNVRLLQSM